MSLRNKKIYKLPSFSESFKEQLTEKHRKLCDFFTQYTLQNKKEDYIFQKNTPGCIISLRQKHFSRGTVRITQPGVYVLEEDIVFNPNPENDFQPLEEDSGLEEMYPTKRGAPYHLGFFAAITIECKEGVILDLNNKKISQSDIHNIQQRFYAHIEIASAPFIPKQGPVKEGFSNSLSFTAGENVLIKNGTLGKTSHHGIHGNSNKNVIIQKLIFKDFEVASIALNGSINTIVENIIVEKSSTDVKVLSTYSQARFIRSFLYHLQSKHPNAHFNGKSIQVIIENLLNDLELAKNAVLNNQKLDHYFINPLPNSGYDGNVYGMVFHTNGVVINDFLRDRDENGGNENILLENIKISNIISRPMEIVALNANPNNGKAYGGSRQVGCVGDVLEIKHILNVNNKYKGNSLSDAQLILTKYKHIDSTLKTGTLNIHQGIVEWAESSKNIYLTMNKHNFYFVYGGDSMGHVMKGNIGLFLSGVKNATINNIIVENVICKKNNITLSKNKHINGASAYGILKTACSNICENNIEVRNIKSENKNTQSCDLFTLL